jgi:hypothetical protein
LCVSDRRNGGGQQDSRWIILLRLIESAPELDLFSLSGFEGDSQSRHWKIDAIIQSQFDFESNYFQLRDIYQVQIKSSILPLSAQSR